MTRREALAKLSTTSLALLCGGPQRFRVTVNAAERPTDMATPAHIGTFTANNPGIMTLQGTNQYIVGKESALVIDVARIQTWTASSSRPRRWARRGLKRSC
jgi:hypothetical protein